MPVTRQRAILSLQLMHAVRRSARRSLRPDLVRNTPTRQSYEARLVDDVDDVDEEFDVNEQEEEDCAVAAPGELDNKDEAATGLAPVLGMKSSGPCVL